MKADPGNSEVIRLEALLRLGRFNVANMGGEPPVILATYFTPMGRRRAACAVLRQASCASAEETARVVKALREASVEEPDEYIIFLTDLLTDSVYPPPPEPIRSKRLDDLALAIINNTQFADVYGRDLEKRVRKEKILPIPCTVELSGGRGALISDAAFDALCEFVRSPLAKLCCVTGSFGTGKSTLLYQLAAQLSKPGPWSGDLTFPLLVDASGCGPHGVRTAIERRITDLFRTKAPPLEELQNLFGATTQLLLIIDSLDEQPELEPKAILSLFAEIVSYLDLGVKIIVAFRPELFESAADQHNLLYRPLTQKGICYRSIALGQFSLKSVKAHLTDQLRMQDVDLPLKLNRLALDLARRPLWLRTVLSYPKVAKVHGGLNLISFLEHCVSEWSIRELQTNRPLLDRQQRDLLTTILALCMHTGHGIHIDRPGRIHRSELVAFVRKLVPLLQSGEPDVRIYMRWLQLPPDLAAESLAIANLLTIDEGGFLTFSERVFYQYFLAIGISTILRGDSDSPLMQSAVLNVFGIQASRDIVGMAPFPVDEEFIDLLIQTGSRYAITEREYLRIAKAVSDASAADTSARVIPKWSQLIFGYNESAPEEARQYEMLVPWHWPRLGSWHSPYNAIVVLRTRGRTEISEMDFGFVNFNGCDLSGLQFVGCRFVGANLSYCNLSGTRFVNCDMSFALLYKVRRDAGTTVEGGESSRLVAMDGDDRREENTSDGWRLVDELAQRDELWVFPKEPIALPENQGFPVRVAPFLVNKCPVSNEQFGTFVKANPEYGRREHSRAIENAYYLAYFQQASEHGDGGKLPVVYVSLIAAVAYALWIGKRLPNAGEWCAYSEVLGNIESPMSLEYWEIAKMDEMQVCKTGYVTEWTYQIDDEEYWRTLPVRLIDPNVASVCPMPIYRRSQAMRCEYLVMGSSYLPKATNSKNSKPATWINADQGFRCVMDYSAAVRRHMQKSNGHSDGEDGATPAA